MKKVSVRQLRIGELLRRLIAHVLMKDIMTFHDKNMYVSISKVTITGDLKIAKIYVSIVLEHDKEKYDILEFIENHSSVITSAISKNIVLKYMPKLKFYLSSDNNNDRNVIKDPTNFFGIDKEI